MPARHALLALLVVGLTACGQALGNPLTAAVVNGEDISVEAVRDLVRSSGVDPATGQAPPQDQATTQAVSELVLLTLLNQYLESAGGQPVTDADVEEALADAAEQAGGTEAFGAQLDAQGISPERVRLDQSFALLVERLNEHLAAGITVGEADIQAAYESGVGQPAVSHILVETEEEAEQVRARLDDGEAFADLAREVSIDTGSGASGGQLGPLQPGAFVPEFEDAARALEAGQISDPVRTDFGYHIITTEQPPELTGELAGQIEENLRTQQAQQELGALVQRVVEDADVEVNPRFGRWEPAFGPNGLTQVISPADPLGDLVPVTAATEGSPLELSPTPPATPPAADR